MSKSKSSSSSSSSSSSDELPDIDDVIPSAASSSDKTKRTPTLTIVSEAQKHAAQVKKGDKKESNRGPVRKMKGVASVPSYDMKELRACMICSLVKSLHQFDEEGCDNCEPVLTLAGRTGSAYSYTSENFEGMIALIEQSESWVARWQHIDTLKKGAYAFSVKGELPMSLKTELIEAGFKYRCRDQSMTPEELAAMRGEQDPNEDGLMKKHRRRRIKKRQSKTTTQFTDQGGLAPANARNSNRKSVDELEGSQSQGDESQIDFEAPNTEDSD